MLYILINDIKKSLYDKLIKYNKNILFLNNISNNDAIRLIIKIAKKIKSSDILCYINQENTILVDNINNITIKYNIWKKTNQNKSLLFSRNSLPTNIFKKYHHDKLIKRWDNAQINPNLFIGDVKSIIDFFSKFNPKNLTYEQYVGSNEQTYVDVDRKYQIFYNYSILNKNINDNINNYELSNPSIVSGIKLKNKYIKYVIIKEGQKTKLNIMKYRNEIIILLLILLILILLKNKKIAIYISTILLLELLHYELFTKHFNRHFSTKIIYTIIDTLHNCLLFGLILFASDYRCNIKKLLILNIGYMISIYLFFVYKRCVITIIENKIIGLNNNYTSVSLGTKINYFLDLNKGYEPSYGDYTRKWMNGNKFNILVIIVYNIYCLSKIL